MDGWSKGLRRADRKGRIKNRECELNKKTEVAD
jgi:hypothetical protein